MDTSGIIVAAIIVIGLTLVVLWKLNIFPFKKEKAYSTEQLPIAWPQTFASYHYTPAGVNCNFENPVTAEEFARFAEVIDMGVRNCIRGYLPQWNNAKNPSDFIIGFIKPTATNQDGSPALIINGIQSAGTVIGYNTAFSPPTIVLPQQTNWDHLGYLMHSVWFEGEHFAEIKNDMGWFWHYVGAGDVHPHRNVENPEMPPVIASLMSNAPTRISCGIKKKDSSGR